MHCSVKLSAAFLCVVLGLVAETLPACDVDAECGPGGTCIKREKRASGACYGRSREGAVEPATPDAMPGARVLPRPVQGERRQRATEFLGDPEQIIRQQLPGKTAGAVCMVSQDCPSGSECVIAGFEGRCVEM